MACLHLVNHFNTASLRVPESVVKQSKFVASSNHRQQSVKIRMCACQTVHKTVNPLALARH